MEVDCAKNVKNSCNNHYLERKYLSDILKQDFVANTFLDGRVLYCSTLGKSYAVQEESGEESSDEEDVEKYNGNKYRVILGKNNPVYFVIVTDTSSKYQAGRFVGRLLTAAYARVMALYGIEALSRVNDKLHKLYSNLGRDEYEDSELRSLRNSLFEIIKEDPKLGGTVLLIVSKSKYYQQINRKNVKDLQSGDLGPWQTYEKFLQRRLEPSFQFISSIRDLIEDVQAIIEIRSRARSLDFERQFSIIGIIVSSIVVGGTITEFILVEQEYILKIFDIMILSIAGYTVGESIIVFLFSSFLTFLVFKWMLGLKRSGFLTNSPKLKWSDFWPKWSTLPRLRGSSSTSTLRHPMSKPEAGGNSTPPNRDQP